MDMTMTDSERIQTVNQNRRDNGQFGQWPRDEGHFDVDSIAGVSADEGDEWTQALEISREAARRYSRTRSIQAQQAVEDIAQDAVMQYWKQRSGGKVIPKPDAWLRRAVFVLVNRYGQVGDGATRQGMAIMKKWREEYYEAHHRHPSAAEIEQEGQRVRMSFPPSRRPWENFWTLPTNGVLHSTDDLLKFAEHNAQPEQPEYVAPDSWTEVALSLTESTTPYHARKLYTAAVCEQNDVKVPNFASLPASVVASHHTALRNYPGGVVGAIRTWELAEDDEGTDALFAPWGKCSIDERDDIAKLLGSNQAGAEEMWASAMAFADVTNKKPITTAVRKATGAQR